MIKLTVDIPIEIGDKVYKTTSKCDIVEGTVSNISVIAKYSSRQFDLTKLKSPTLDVTITVRWSLAEESFDVCDLDKVIFTSKEKLIKHIVDLL